MNAYVSLPTGDTALECLGRCPVADGTEPLLVGFSVRNRRFDRKFFGKAGLLARTEFSHLVVAILDVPYAFNDAARRGGSKPSGQEIEKALRIGDEREQMVRRALGRVAGLEYSIRRWSDLETESVRSMRAELARAVETDWLIRDLLMSYSAHWAAAANEQLNESMVGFQICELPVLFDLYYRERLLNDLYPGKVVDFFFRLERGDFRKSLPLATSLSHGHRLSCLRFASDAAECDRLEFAP